MSQPPSPDSSRPLSAEPALVVAAVRGALAAEPDVHWAYVFGSAGRGEPYRDVDVAFVGRPDAFRSVLDLGRLIGRLARRLGLDESGIDLVDLDHAALPLVASVLDEGVIVLDRQPESRRLWEAERTLRWLDFRPVWETQLRLRREASRRRLMVQAEKLARLLDVLRDALSDLSRYASTVSEESLHRDRDTRYMVLYAMYIATQAAIDSASHILASRGLPRATSYAEIFDRLSEGGILPPDLGRDMAAWASMRNVLAHFYPVLDMAQVHRALREDLGSLRDFIEIADRLVGVD